MIKSQAFVQTSAKKIKRASNCVIDAYRRKLVEDENSITNRLLQAVSDELDGKTIKGVKWEAKTLKAGKNNKQESKYGADFIGELEIKLAGYSVNKGFLAQAKMLEPEDPISKIAFPRLLDQCEKMLQVTPDSFVFIYSKNGINIVPAISVVAAGKSNLYELYYKNISVFFEEHFKSFIGDRNIKAEDINSLVEAKKNLDLNRGILLKARSICHIRKN